MTMKEKDIVSNVRQIITRMTTGTSPYPMEKYGWASMRLPTCWAYSGIPSACRTDRTQVRRIVQEIWKLTPAEPVGMKERASRKEVSPPFNDWQRPYLRTSRQRKQDNDNI